MRNIPGCSEQALQVVKETLAKNYNVSIAIRLADVKIRLFKADHDTSRSKQP